MNLLIENFSYLFSGWSTLLAVQGSRTLALMILGGWKNELTGPGVLHEFASSTSLLSSETDLCRGM